MMFDSLTLYSQALDVVSWHKEHGYYVEAYYDAAENPHTVMDRAVGRFYDYVDEGKYRLSNGKYVNWLSMGIKEDTYRVTFSQHEFLQRDPSVAYVNIEAPFQYFDRRIKPHKIVRMYCHGDPKFKKDEGDIVYIYLYPEPTKVVVSPKQQELLYFLNGYRIDKQEYLKIVETGTDTVKIGKNYNFLRQ